MKNRVRYFSILCLAVAFVMCIAQLGSVIADAMPAAGVSLAAGGEETSVSVQDEGVVRPENIDEGLSLKSLKDIQGRRVTVRQPVMEVTNYHVARPKNVPVLEDTYVLGDFTTREVLHKDAKVTFTGDTGDPKSKDPKYPMKGLENSPKNGEGAQKYFTCFEKYMLLRQAYYFNQHAMEIVEEGKLVKHPAADGIYGHIPDNAEAVTMHIVTDPIYRSPMTTGLYLVPGEKATVTIRGLKKGATLTFYTHHQDTLGYRGYDENSKDLGTDVAYFKYWDDKILDIAQKAEAAHTQPDFTGLTYGLQGQWVWQNQKVPCMGTTFTITGDGSEEMTVGIGSMYGGPLYVKPTETSVDFEITGAVLTPHFVLGVTTVEDFEKYYRNAPGLIATLDVENGQLIGPAEDMRNADDIEKLGYFWHSVFAIDISLNGREYNYNMTMCYDMHVPAGEAVALNSNFCAQPTYWFGTCMNYKKLTTNGNWGTLHELGHVQAKTYGVNWGFAEGDGEVWNNTLILIIYSMLCNMDSRLDYVEHGEYVHPYTTVLRSQNITKEYTKDGQKHKITDYGQINNGDGAHFDQLSMYATLIHSFGPEKFIDMFYTYKLDPAYCKNKRADFVYRIALVDRVNILDWVNGNYFANINPSDFSESQLQFLESLPTFYPVAYRWANGIDGNETARKYEVDGKHPTVFDLSGDNITSPQDVRILEVTNPGHGTLEYDENTQKVTYTPPAKATEYDGFDIVVSAYGGRQVTLNVRFKLLYRGVHTEVWDLTEGGKTAPPKNVSVDSAWELVKDRDPDSTEVGSVPGKGDFDHKNAEYFRMQFKFVASEEGNHTFYLRADDAARVKFFKEGKDFTDTPDGTMTTASDKQYFDENDKNRVYTVSLQKGETLNVLAELVNWGGKGHLHIGLRMPGEEGAISDIPIANIVNADVTDEDLQTADSFAGWQPRFVDSIKDVTMDRKSETSKWSILQAPACEGTNSQEHLIDGDESTIYHSRYTGSKPQLPHVFVIDTGSEQEFNFFEVLRRTNGSGNDKLLEYALYGCGEEAYKTAAKDENTNGWTVLFEKSAPANVDAARQRITFDEQQLRYFKFVVFANGGQTVIKELSAGLQTLLNQTVRPRAYETEKGLGGFEENSANGKLTAKKAGAEFEFAFLGSGFELYADTAPGYGKARVTVDEREAEEVDLGGGMLFNTCVYQSHSLELGPHTVRVVTDSEKPFNISFINVVYGTPVDEEDYPALQKDDGTEDFGDEEVPRLFTREWRTYVKDYKELTSIKFVKAIPEGYRDTYRRIDGYIRIYRGTDDPALLAFVYPGTIVAPSECGSLFAGCEKLTELVFDNFDTSSMRGASSMFSGCASLASIDLKDIKTENVQSMGSMFAGCGELCSLDLSGFCLAENANIQNMFARCGSLSEIKLPAGIAEDAASLLPGIFHDEDSNAYTYTVTKANAGHTLTLHDEHDYDMDHAVAAVAPTCTADGARGYCKCSVCHFEFDPAAQYELLTEKNRTLPATGHSGKYVLGRMPTCTTDGESYQIVCEICEEVLEYGEAIPALGHYYLLDTSEEHVNGYLFTCDADGTAKLTVYLACMMYDYNFDNKPCDSKIEIVIPVAAVSHTEATCTENAAYTFDRTIGEEDILAVLNPAGKEVADSVYGIGNIVIRETKILEGSLGHLYGEPSFAWSGDNTSAQATFVCTRDGCLEGAAGHTLTVDAEMSCFEKVEATCLADAYTRYTATARAHEGGAEYTDSRVNTEHGTQKSHEYTGVYLQTEGGRHERKCVNGCEQYGDAEECTAQASWHQEGEKHYRLCVCGRHLDEGNHTFEVSVSWPAAHGEAATLKEAPLVCHACNARAEGTVSVAEKAGSIQPTCEHAGSIAYTVTVEYGGKTYTAESQSYEIERAGHDYAPAAQDALAWTLEGHYATATLRLVCNNCDDGEANHVREIHLAATVEGDPSAVCGSNSGRTVYTVDPAQENTLHTIGIEIGENRFDEAAVKNLARLTYTAEDSLICHVWRLTGGELKWTVAENDNAATLAETFRCERCGETITVTFEGECTIVNATCDHAGQIIFTVTEKNIDEVKQAANAGGHTVALYADDTFDALPRRQYSVEGEKQLEHQFEDVEEIPATCTGEGRTAGHRCRLCGYTDVEIIPAKQHVEQAIPGRAPTCTMSGAEGGVWCTVCGETLSPQSEIPALGHTEHGLGDGKAATCTEAGRTESISCTRCNQIVRESEVIPAKGHTEHGLGDGKAATCTEAGRTESVTCSECGATLRESEVIPAKGHTWETIPGKAATETESGLTEGEQCAECGEVRKAQEEIPPLGKAGLGAGAIAGIAAGGAAVLAACTLGLFFLLRKKSGK